MSKIDVTAMGELLIDFTENGISNQGNPLLEANPGGAPCNVLSMLTNLGHSTAFIGKVGDDIFGEMLKERVSGLNINIENLVMDKEVNTTYVLYLRQKMETEAFHFTEIRERI